MTTRLASLLPLAEVAVAVEETYTTPAPCLEYGRLADCAAIITYIAGILRLI